MTKKTTLTGTVTSLVGILAFLLTIETIASAQDETAPKGKREVMMTIPNVIDKLLATEQVLAGPLKWTTRQSWNAGYKELYTKYHKDFIAGELEKRGRPTMALALGIKASDGVLALQARHKESLNDCADQIEAIARKLDVPGAALARAGMVKQKASKNEWIEAFMYLGYLQQSVMNHVEQIPKQKDEFLLIIMGSWIQGGAAVTDLILREHSTASSNILREPKLVELMISEFTKMRPEYLADPLVKAVQEILPGVQQRLNVGLHAPIPKKDVEWLHAEFTRLISLIVGGPAAAKSPEPATTVEPPKAPTRP